MQKQDRVYACLHRRDRHFRAFFLGVRRDDYVEVDDVRLAGRFVAYGRRAGTAWMPRVIVREPRGEGS